jgi:dTDP-4-dehydrorhamnose reductase
MLGHKLVQVLSADFEVVATTRSDVPGRPEIYGRARRITDVDALAGDSVAEAIDRVRPDVVVNAIGVVKQRATASDPVLSISVNSLFPHRLAQICAQTGARLIHFSTDCVFSGARGGYSERDIPDPIDLYGRSKLLGEVDGPEALTIRTSIIGRELEHHTGLLEWFLAQAGGRVHGYAKVIWSGVTTNFLARTVARIVQEDSGLRGVVHLSGPAISKYELLIWLDEAFGTRTAVERDDTPISDRSLDSERFWAATGFERPRWPDLIQELVAESSIYKEALNARR